MEKEMFCCCLMFEMNLKLSVTCKVIYMGYVSHMENE